MSDYAHAALPLLVVAPVLVAVGSFLYAPAGRWLGLLGSAGVVWGTASVISSVAHLDRLEHAIGGWGAPLGIELRVDGLSALLLLVTAVVGTGVTVYAFTYFGAPETRPRRDGARADAYFWPLWLTLWGGLNALFVSGDVFNLYVTLELVGFAGIGLVAVGGGRDALAAAFRYLLVSLSGSLFFLLGVAIAYGTLSTLDLATLSGLADAGEPGLTALALMTFGLVMKGALFPLHFWLPPAHASAPAPVSAALSALVVKGPFYILLRLWSDALASGGDDMAAQWLSLLGVAAILWGSVQALRQVRLKMLVAYSTVAQLGYFFLLFAFTDTSAASQAARNGVLLMLAAHACAKAAMFLGAGNVMRLLGHDRIAELGPAAASVPMSFFAFGVAGLSIIGLPPSGGFAGKWLLITAAIETGRWWLTFVVLAGSLLAGTYILRCVRPVFVADDRPPAAGRVPRTLELTALLLALTAAAMGLAASLPLELLDAGPWIEGPFGSRGGE